MIKRITLATAATALLLCGSALASDAITERQAGFDGLKKSMGDLRGLVSSDLTAAAAVGTSMAEFGARIPSLFPAGSDQGKTDALPAIWANADDFAARAKAFEDASKKLAAAAATGDKAATGDAMKAVGGTCKACHDQYRK